MDLLKLSRDAFVVIVLLGAFSTMKQAHADGPFRITGKLILTPSATSRVANVRDLRVLLLSADGSSISERESCTVTFAFAGVET